MSTIKLSSCEKETLTSRGYQLLSKLGEGAYAQVYLSSYKDSSLKLACKIVDVPKMSANYVNKFLPRELNILSSIKSPHIVHVHSIFRRNLKYFIFMRFAEKGDLMDWIIANGPVSQFQSKFWTRQIISGMQYLQQKGIAHRDIKCENLLITEKNNIKLTDFGFSRYIKEHDTHGNFSETFCGSLLYVAPEIVKGIAYNPFQSDMWSLGIVIFTMLNKTVPFNETNPSLIYELQMSQKYRFRDSNPAFMQVKNLIKRLLQPEPKKRPTILTVLQHEWFTTDNLAEEVNTELTDSKKTEDNLLEDCKSSKLQKASDTQKSVMISLEEIMKSDVSSSEDTTTFDPNVSKGRTEDCKENQNEKYENVKSKEKTVDQDPGIKIISKSTIVDD